MSGLGLGAQPLSQPSTRYTSPQQYHPLLLTQVSLSLGSLLHHLVNKDGCGRIQEHKAKAKNLPLQVGVEQFFREGCGGEEDVVGI